MIGVVIMMTELTKKEQLSALMDGELTDEQWDAAWAATADDESLLSWHAYHLVGDVLRSNELASATSGSVLLGALRERLSQEPVLQPVAIVDDLQKAAVVSIQPRVQEAANASVFRWKLAAGFASLAAVAAVGWSVLLTAPSSPPGGAQLASVAPSAAQPASASGNLIAVAGVNNPAQVMIRDPRLDELMAAHRQFGATNTLQMPAGYLRNATFDSPSR